MASEGMDEATAVATFSSVTGADLEPARFFLELSGWNMEQAISAFFDQGGAVFPRATQSKPIDIPPRTQFNEKSVSFIAASYGTHLQKGLNRLLASRMFSDVVLNVRQEGQDAPQRIPAHKFVLSLASEEFRLLLSKPQRQVDAMEEEDALTVTEIDIDLEHVPIRIFNHVLNYIYTGTTAIMESDLVLLLELAAKYGIVSLREKCGEMLFDNRKDVASLMEIAMRYKCDILLQQCGNYLASKWVEVSKDGTLLRLTPTMLEEVLRHDSIEADEEEILETVLRYAQDQVYQRADRVLEQLLPSIRFPLLNTRFLLEEVTKIPVLEILSISHELVHEALRYKLYPTHLTNSNRCRARKGSLKWSLTEKSKNINLSENRLTASFKSAWPPLGNCTYGVHTYYFRIDSCPSQWIFIGVAGKTWQVSKAANRLTYLGNDAPSWAFCSSPGWGITNTGSSNVPYGPPTGFTTPGDIVKMTLDMDKGTLSFGVNAVDYGVAFRNLQPGVRVGVSLYGQGDCVSIVRNYHQDLAPFL